MTGPFAHKQLFYSELAKLLEAGFGIREAADVMTGTGLPAAQARLLQQMHHGLNEGKSISESLAADRAIVTDLERSIICAGERGGRMPTAMRHLADYFGMLASARREMIKGLIHPVIALHLGVFIGTVPTAMIRGGQSFAASATGLAATLLAAFAIAFAVFMGIRALLRNADTHSRSDRLIRRIPLVGSARRNLAMSGFCKVYHTGLLAGLPMRETIRLAAEASQSGMIRAAGIRLEHTVAQGNPLGPEMMADPSFPKAFARSYATGEAAGTLDKDLANWAVLFQNDAESGIKTLAAVIPRVLYFLILGYVAFKIVGFYDSYYGSLLKELVQT